MKKILALYGKHDSGKTETLLRVIEKLKSIADEKLFYKKYGTTDEDDATAIFRFDTIIIGITSRGDIGPDLKKILDMFFDGGCIIIICPTRKTQRPNGSVEVVKTFSAEHQYELVWIEKERTETEDETIENEINAADAEHIIDEVKKLLPTEAI